MLKQKWKCLHRNLSDPNFAEPLPPTVFSSETTRRIRRPITPRTHYTFRNFFGLRMTNKFRNFSLSTINEDLDPNGSWLFYVSNFRKSSFVSPACCMIARRVPFWIVSWRGTVILCLPSVRYMWLPFWWTTLKPALFRIFRSLRCDSVGSFSDSYFHQLSFSFKLV